MYQAERLRALLGEVGRGVTDYCSKFRGRCVCYPDGSVNAVWDKIGAECDFLAISRRGGGLFGLDEDVAGSTLLTIRSLNWRGLSTLAHW